MVFSVYYIRTETFISQVQSSRSQLVVGRTIFFSRVKSVVRGLSLARTHLRTNFCDMAFSCVCLGVYTIKACFSSFPAVVVVS